MPELLGTFKEFILADNERLSIYESGRGFCASYIEHYPLIERDLLSPKYKVYKNNQLWTTVGKARFHACTIELNKALFWDQFQVRYKDQMNETFFHELSHHIAYLWAQHQGHGKEWRQVMRSFGYKPAAILRGEAAFSIVHHLEEKREHGVNEVDKLMGGSFGE